MTRYIVRRLLGIVINLALVSLFAFFLLQLIPGNTAQGILGLSATTAQKQAFEKAHGLDKGPVEQYLRWVGNALRGDLGVSLRTNQHVSTEFMNRFPITLEIVILSFTFTSVLGLIGGIVSATKQDSFWDYFARVGAIFGISIPSFLMLTLLLVLPAKYLHYAPPFGATHFFSHPLDNLSLLVPPTLLLAVGSSATLMRITRTVMLDTLRQDYVRTARSKGLAERTLILKHALRNALLPVLTLMGLQLSALLGGSVIVEQVLDLPGLGTWDLIAIQAKDYPIIMAFTMYAAVVLMSVTLLVDVLYAALDPRVRYS